MTTDETGIPRSVADLLTQKWRALAWRGVFAVIFGVLVFFWLRISLVTLVMLFGGYALADGVFAVASAIDKATDKTSERKQPWWPMLLQGVVGIAAGVLTLGWPDITALVLLYLIAAWAIITGIFQIVQAIGLRKEIKGEWLLVLGGIASVVFGLLLEMFPGEGALAVGWLIGTYSMVFGILLLFLAFRLRQRVVQEPRGMSPKAT
jgi:uncharacterized membrane protein HdeD (DUF308 family)